MDTSRAPERVGPVSAVHFDQDSFPTLNMSQVKELFSEASPGVDSSTACRAHSSSGKSPLSKITLPYTLETSKGNYHGIVLECYICVVGTGV